MTPQAWLADIVSACDLLVEFTTGKTFNDYAADPLLRSAVERQFEMWARRCALLAARAGVGGQHQRYPCDHRLTKPADSRLQRCRSCNGCGAWSGECRSFGRTMNAAQACVCSTLPQRALPGAALRADPK